MNKYRLTEEHKAQIPQIVDKWIKNALSTKPMDQEEKNMCTKAVNQMYEIAGLKQPKHIIFVSSPFILGFAGEVSSAIDLEIDSAIFSATVSKTVSETDSAIDLEIDSATISETRLATDSAIYSAIHSAAVSKTVSETRAGIDLAMYSATDSATRLATRSAIYSAIYSATDSATDSATNTKSDLNKWYTIDNCLAEFNAKFNLNRLGIKKSQNVCRSTWQGGNQWSGWCGYIDFFRNIAKLEQYGVDYSKYDCWESLAIHSGPRLVTENFCMISDRPEVLLVDEQFRPHCTTGPFCRWRDGSSLFAIHGVYMPAWIILQPEKITPDLIEKESNIEIRRNMLTIYGVDRYLIESKFEVLDIDKDQFGQQRRLLRKTNMDDEAIVRVEVINSSPELDASYKTYYLPVHPELIPMKNGKLVDKGRSQKMTCHNAVASTFGKYGEEYGVKGQFRQGDVFIEFKDGSNQKPFQES